MKKVTAIIIILIFLLLPLDVFAKGGGGRGGGGRSFSSGSRTTTSKSTTTVSKPAPARAPSSTTKTITSTPKTVNGKTYSGKGYVVDKDYQPAFRGGYTPPAGSTVYYRDSGSSFLNWLPFWYIMTHDGSKEAVVVQPDGKEQEVKEEGTDGMYILNWILVILIALGLIGGIVYLINKMTRKEVSYGY